MSNLFKSTFVTFTPENKKVIKIDHMDPRILNPDFGQEVKDAEFKPEKKDKAEKANKIIADAKEEAESIIEKAMLEAEHIKNSAFDEGHKEGYEIGYEKGFAQAEQQIEQLKEELVEEQEKKYNQLIDELEPRFAEITIELLEKLTGVLLKEKKELILYLINQGIRTTEASKSYIIHVSSDEFDHVMEEKDRIEHSQNPNIKIEIVGNPHFTKGQCKIETETGIIDSSLDTQLSGLISDIQLLSNV